MFLSLPCPFGLLVVILMQGKTIFFSFSFFSFSSISKLTPDFQEWGGPPIDPFPDSSSFVFFAPSCFVQVVCVPFSSPGPGGRSVSGFDNYQ